MIKGIEATALEASEIIADAIEIFAVNKQR